VCKLALLVCPTGAHVGAAAVTADYFHIAAAAAAAVMAMHAAAATVASPAVATMANATHVEQSPCSHTGSTRCEQNLIYSKLLFHRRTSTIASTMYVCTGHLFLYLVMPHGQNASQQL
jgi:hypothetical protein